jgi:RHS repeat-associated protein
VNERVSHSRLELYNYFRDYDPSTGKYAESDPIGLEGGINTYAYGGSNPLVNIDPEGLTYFCMYSRLGSSPASTMTARESR